MGRGKKGKKAAPGTWLERNLFCSRAYLELTGFAPQLLIIFLSKRDMSNPRRIVMNKDSITMTFKELEGFYISHEAPGFLKFRKDLSKGISRPRIVRAIDSLLAHGFIQVVHRGGAYQQDKSVYGLVEDWRNWLPGVAIRTREPDTRARGYNCRLKKPNPAYESVPLHTNEPVPIID